MPWRRIILVLLISAAIALVPAVLTQPHVVRGHRVQWLYPESRAYQVQIDVWGRDAARPQPPEEFRIGIAGGRLHQRPDEPRSFDLEPSGLGWTVWVRSADLMWSELGGDRFRPAGTLDHARIRSALAAVGAPESPQLDEESAELTTLLTAVSRNGWSALSFEDSPQGARALGRLRHFDAYGSGASGFRTHPSVHFLAWWSGATVIIAVPLGLLSFFFGRRGGRAPSTRPAPV